MKKILTIITLAAMIMVAGCVDLDDILRRLDASESKLAEQGRELATMKSLVDAMDKKISVQSYKELADKSGYELTMSDGSKITLKHGVKGEKGDQGNPGQDGDANLTITEVGNVIIIVYKGVTYTLPKGEAPVTMTLTTAKNVGEKITLRINAAAADQPEIWIDLNNNGKKDEGEAVTVFGSNVDYLLGAQTVTVYGKVTALYCHQNSLTTLDVRHNTALTELFCHNNQLTSLDVSKNTALTKLWCPNNSLKALDVSHNKALEELDCGGNQLTTLNVSKNTALTGLFCYNNQLTSLDISKNTALTTLNCISNQLTSLDVSNNTALTRLHCYQNQLTSLDVSHNKALEKLHCYQNQLTSLEVSNSIALTELYCFQNQLTSLDVSHNTALNHLSCNQNQLTSLDVSHNKALEELYCGNNQLTSLDVSHNTALTLLSCHSNQLTSLDVSNNTALTRLVCYSNKISGDNMTSLVNSLPTRTAGNEGSFRVINLTDSNEQNKCTTAQVGIATGKNWKVMDSGGNPYPGSD